MDELIVQLGLDKPLTWLGLVLLIPLFALGKFLLDYRRCP